MASHRFAEAPFTVLFVCTGNICRSPIAERVTRSYLDSVLGTDASCIELASAGTNAVVGAGVHVRSAAVLTSLGGESGGFVARQLTDDMVVGADLTLGLTRAHRRAALKRSPRGLARTFTLLEAAALASLVPADADLSGFTFVERCRSLVGQLALARARRFSDAYDDVPDPVGEPEAFHQEVGDAIADGVVRLFSRFADLSTAPRLFSDRWDEASSAYYLSRR